MSSLFFLGEIESGLINLILILGVPLALAFYAFGKYYSGVQKENRMVETFSQSAQKLVNDKGFEMRPAGSPEGAQLIKILGSFERLKLQTVRFFVHNQAIKKEGDHWIAAFVYKWSKTRKFKRSDADRNFRVDNIYGEDSLMSSAVKGGLIESKHDYRTESKSVIRTGIFFSLPLELMEPVFVRGRRDWEEEDQLELDEGMPTPPAIGIPDFDLSFVCKGKNPVETGKVVTKEMQELILGHQGKYPILPNKNRLMRVYFSEEGINFTVEEAPDEKQILEMYELAEKIFNLAKTQSSPDEQIIKAQ